MVNLQKQKLITADDLRQVKEILDGLGVKFWLTLGTSLGAFRDKDFCPEDVDDIDLGVEYEAYPRRAEIIQAFKANGFKHLVTWEATDKISTEDVFTKQYDGFHSKIDLWFYTPNPENPEELLFRMYKGNNKEYRTYILPKRFHDEFQEIMFYGQLYLIPKDIEGYLEHNFGKEWKTPISRSQWNYYTANHSPIK